MITLALQCLVVVATCAFGALALSLGRQGSEATPHWAWRLTGQAFLTLALIGAVHNGFAVAAFAAGPGSTVFEMFLRWSPTGNHIREGIAVAFGVCLALGLVRPGARRLGIGGLLIGALVGVVVGWLDGPLVVAQHFVWIASLRTIELLVFFVALITALSVRGLDRYLWLTLAIYSARQAIAILFWSSYAWFEIPGVWTPSPWVMPFLSVAGYAAMIVLVQRARVLVRRGEVLEGIAGPLGSSRRSLMGWE